MGQTDWGNLKSYGKGEYLNNFNPASDDAAHTLSGWNSVYDINVGYSADFTSNIDGTTNDGTSITFGSNPGGWLLDKGQLGISSGLRYNSTGPTNIVGSAFEVETLSPIPLGGSSDKYYPQVWTYNSEKGLFWDAMIDPSSNKPYWVNKTESMAYEFYDLDDGSYDKKFVGDVLQI